MAAYKLLNHLRRSRPTSYLSTLSQSHLLTNLNPNPNRSSATSPSFFSSTPKLPRPLFQPRSVNSIAGALSFFNSRSIFTRAGDDSEFVEPTGGFDYDSSTKLDGIDSDLATESTVLETTDLGFGVMESILPVQTLIQMLDGFHELTGLPWWIVIVSSTLALRVTLFPLLILQLSKLKLIGELFPKLPPPLPPPFSGRSYIDQISLFRKERKALGCPSFLWFLAYVSVQVPCFLLGMISIRRMSLDHHPGFDCGGALWFQNLTALPSGVLGATFPLLIAALHYANIQIAFRTSSLKKTSGLFDLLVKYYKIYLDFLTLPLLFLTFYIPQGSLVYWVTNSSLTAMQQLSLQHPDVRAKFGLPDKDKLITKIPEDMGTPEAPPFNPPENLNEISVQDLSPQELLALSVQLLSKGQMERAISMLKLALEKDPHFIKALIVMGQTQMQEGRLEEAIEYLERAISRLFLTGGLTAAENTDLLILASQWAGVCYIRQEKTREGLVHLERVGRLKEPEDPRSKAHYFDGLLLLSSVLYREGRKGEAVKYLRLAAAYDPAYNEYVEQCENDEEPIVSDLVSSRRKDYQP